MKKNSIFVIVLIGALTFFNFYVQNQFSSQYKNFAPIDALYHGSGNRNIKIFEPRLDHIRDEKEGSVIFATPSIQLASCFLFKWDDSWVHQSISWKENNKADYKVIMVISDKVRFNQEDLGGAIYILPAHSFEYDKNNGLGIYEWTSKEKVLPFTQINFSSALEAMQIFGVQVYFVNSEQFKYYINLPGEEQEKFLLNLDMVKKP